MRHKLLLAATSFIALAHTSQANINLLFDMSQLGNPSLTADDIWVSFGGHSSNMTFDPNGTPEPINFSSSLISYTTGNVTTFYNTSKAYKLSDIAAKGISISTASSISGFISYGNGTAFNKMTTGLPGIYTNPQTPRYSQFEFTINNNNGTVSGGADLTNITQFGGSLRMDFKTAGNTVQSYVANTANTTAMFQKLSAVSGGNPNAVVTSNGQFVRAIGANFYPASISGVAVNSNPYGTFNQYFQSLYAGSGNGTGSVVSQLTNLAPGANPGGQGSAGFAAISSNSTRGITSGTTYNLDYHFTANLTQATTPSGPSNPYGTYSLNLSGYVNATAATGNSTGNTTVYGAAATGNQTSGGSTPLTITIPADDLISGNWTLSNAIYQQNLTNPTIGYGGWTNIISDFGSATVSSALQQKVAGDFSQGILMGFVGSSSTTNVTTANGTQSVALGSQTSYQWFTNSPAVGYAFAQPTNPFYSSWANVVSSNSAGNNAGTLFPAGGVYGNPYDDRFGLNTIGPDNNTASMLITLLPDGTLAVPEPSVVGLFIAGAAVALVANRKGRRRS